MSTVNVGILARRERGKHTSGERGGKAYKGLGGVSRWGGGIIAKTLATTRKGGEKIKQPKEVSEGDRGTYKVGPR